MFANRTQNYYITGNLNHDTIQNCRAIMNCCTKSITAAYIFSSTTELPDSIRLWLTLLNVIAATYIICIWENFTVTAFARCIEELYPLEEMPFQQTICRKFAWIIEILGLPVLK